MIFKTTKINLTFLFFLMVSSFAFAQESEKENKLSDVRKNNYQIELGFRSIKSIYDNTSSATILLKKKFNPGKLIDVNAVRFLRTYFSINTQINFTEDPTRMTMDSTMAVFHPADIIDLTFGIGIEKQFQNDKFVHYMGMDLYTNYFKSDDDYPGNSNFGGVIVNATNTTDRFVRSLSPGIIAFGGFKYYLSNQFSIGIETGFQASYFNTKFTEVDFENELIDGEQIRTFVERESVTSNGFRFRFLGLRFITLGYSFK